MIAVAALVILTGLTPEQQWRATSRPLDPSVPLHFPVAQTALLAISLRPFPKGEDHV